jgi:hypothetical protein
VYRNRELCQNTTRSALSEEGRVFSNTMIPDFVRRMFPEVDFDDTEEPEDEDDDTDEWFPPEGGLKQL